MGRRRGSKDKSPRKRKLSPIQRTQLIVAGGGSAVVGLTGLGLAYGNKVNSGIDKKSRRVGQETDEAIARSIGKISSPQKASGYKGLSRAQKTAKVQGRVARMGLNRAALAKTPRKLRAIVGRTAATIARRKYGLKYSNGMPLTMFFIGDHTAEFKRGKDRQPRKRRMTAVNAVGYGGLGGIGVDTVRRIGQVRSINKQAQNRYVKAGKGVSAGAVEKIMTRSRLIGPKSNIRSLKAYGIGAAAGLGAYGAYKLGKSALRRKKKR